MRSLVPSLSVVRRVSTFAVALLATLASAPAQAYSGQFDGGGRVGDYLDIVSSANGSGGGMDISGVCASACTMKLGVRGACVHADTQLWFHAARDTDGRVNTLGTLLMMQEYPHAIRSWAMSHGALATGNFTKMSGVQAIALGVANCDRGSPAVAGLSPVAPGYTPRPARQAAYCARPVVASSTGVCPRSAAASLVAAPAAASFSHGNSSSTYALASHALAH